MRLHHGYPGRHTTRTQAEHLNSPLGLKELEKVLEGAHVSGEPWHWG